MKSFVPGNWKPTGGSDVTLEGTKLTVEATATEHRALELFLREWRDYLKRNKVYRAQ